MARRYKTIAWCAAAAGLVVLLAAVFAAKNVIIAEWMIPKLDSLDLAERKAAMSWGNA